ncbi:MAG TPA: hypothetical protein VF665_05515 [Longimicrobium sp.]|jgi:hypothetical protein|uniref:hypothetical protein n=1 Tax=Longimicrobium sp. TaxID=2029185 RepID=UPI002EDAB1BB
MAHRVSDSFDEHLHALGSLVVNFNSVEHALQRIAWLLINPRDNRPGQIVLNAIGVARVEDLVEALGSHLVQPVPVRDRIVSAITECRRIRTQRNDYVHAMWRVPNDATDLSAVEAVKVPTRKTPDYRVVDATASAEPISAVVRAAFELSEQLEQLFAELSGSSPRPEA